MPASSRAPALLVLAVLTLACTGDLASPMRRPSPLRTAGIATFAPVAASSQTPRGRILVVRYFNRSDQADLFIGRPSGKLRRLTVTPGFESSAVFSPGGTRIAFVRRSPNKRRFSLLVMRSDGSGVRHLAEGAFGGVEWSPDGRWISFIRLTKGSQNHLAVVSRDGAEERTLAVAPYMHGSVDWDPDASRILFSQRLDPEGIEDIDIYSAALDGIGVARLTDSPGEDFGPHFSLDGSRIIFSSDRDDLFLAEGEVRSSELYVVNPDGSEESRMTNTPDTWDEAPRWSPDGHLVAFSRRYDDDVRVGPGADSDIVVIDPAENAKQVLTRDRNYNDVKPLWSPDGRWIAFERYPRNGDTDIFVVRLDRGALLRVTNNEADDYVSDWSMRD